MLLCPLPAVAALVNLTPHRQRDCYNIIANKSNHVYFCMYVLLMSTMPSVK